MRENTLCPLGGVDDETSVQLLGKCPAAMVKRNDESVKSRGS